MTTTKLSDIQRLLLTTATQRDDGCLLPQPKDLRDQATHIRREDATVYFIEPVA